MHVIGILLELVYDFEKFLKRMTIWDVISYLIILGMISVVGVPLYFGISSLM
jgi:hypothetical protein